MPLFRFRSSMRGKVQRAVEEVVSEHNARLLDELRDQNTRLRDDLHREIDQVRALTIEFDARSRTDLFAAGERDAAVSSARLIQRWMHGARHLPDPRATLEFGLSLSPAEGMALEFGVYSGGTLRTIAEARVGIDVFGFDSFEGLPEHWRAGFPAGTFGEVGRRGLPEVPGAELVVGWFADTLPGFMDSHPGPVAFLHVDADLYSSTATIFEHVGPRLQPGSMIVFDEFFNYPGWEDGEYRAWDEFVSKTGCEFTYEAYTVNNQQVAVRIL